MIAKIEKSMQALKEDSINENDAIRCAIQKNCSLINLNESSSSQQDSQDNQKIASIPLSVSFKLSEDDYNWKRSICNKTQKNLGKKINMSIHNKYSILSKMNTKLSNCMKLITHQIRHQILQPKAILENSSKIQIETQKIEKNEHVSENKQVFREEILPDKIIVKESCYRSLLKSTQIDNDVPSDDQDLNMGIRYMYRELLYSVGSQIVNQRENQKQYKTKHISKKEKKANNNKQNVNINLPQEFSKKEKKFHQIQKTRQPERNLNRTTLTIRN